MGKRGPARTPTDILKLRGSTLVRTRKGEPEPALGRPDCPDWLEAEARDEWTRQTALLEAEGRLAKIDRAALAMYCAAWGEWVFAYRWVEENGPTSVTDKGNVIQHPMVGRANKSREAAMKLGQQFGFTPASRANMAGPEKKQKDHGKQRFFKQPG